MKIQYDILFGVEIFHEYYSQYGIEYIDIEPSKHCYRQLSNYGLLYKKTPSGFVVLYEAEEDNAGRLHPIRKIDCDIKFSFNVKVTDRYLINCSDLPIQNTAGKIYYLHNLNKNKQGDNLLLTKDISVNVMGVKDLIELLPCQFSYDFESVGQYALIEILDDADKKVFSKNLKAVEGIFCCNIDLNSYAPGRFSLKVNGDERMLFYADNSLISKEVFAVIEIQNNNSVPNDYRFIDSNNDAVKKIYRINIRKRHAYWKYYVVLKYRSDIKEQELSIVYPLQGVSFNRVGTVVMSDSSKAVLFISDSTLPLQRIPVKGIQLKRTNGAGSNTFVVENLPNASAVNLIHNQDEERFYSEIFVYI